MTTLSASEASRRLSTLVDEVKETHQPVQIVGEGGSAILVSEEDWRAILEAHALQSAPGAREAIREDIGTPVDTSDEDLGW